MLHAHPCKINSNNIAEIIGAMPEAGRSYLAWLLAQGVVSVLDYHVQIGLGRYQEEQRRLQQWADEWDNRYSLEKAA